MITLTPEDLKFVEEFEKKQSAESTRYRGMTIDEAIERYTSNAKYERTHENLQGCLEFRQLAEWLKELQRYREAWEKVKEQINEEVYWANSDFDEYKTDILGVDIADVPGDDFRYGLERAIEIINKHLQEVNS